MLFKCRVCDEKDKRINDLKIQMHYWRGLASSTAGSNIPTPTLLTDLALSNDSPNDIDIDTKILEAEQAAAVELQSVLAEREALLSGNY